MFFIYKYLNRFCYEIRVKLKKESGMLWWIVFENICYVVLLLYIIIMVNYNK